MWTLAYDIPDNRRRNQISRLLSSYGERVQRSVFECQLSAPQLGKLMKRLDNSLDFANDSFRAYPVCSVCQKGILAIGKPITDDPDYFVL